MTTKQLPSKFQVNLSFTTSHAKLEREPVCGNIQGRPPQPKSNSHSPSENKKQHANKLRFWTFIAKGKDVRVNISQDTINIG